MNKYLIGFICTAVAIGISTAGFAAASVSTYQTKERTVQKETRNKAGITKQARVTVVKKGHKHKVIVNKGTHVTKGGKSATRVITTKNGERAGSTYTTKHTQIKSVKNPNGSVTVTKTHHL